MPDHLHFVARLKTDSLRIVNAGARGVQVEGVLDHLARFKSYTTAQAWKLGVSGPLWQKSSYDRVMDLERTFDAIVEYVLNNPVRKAWVQEWQQWPYSKIVDLWA
jgi:hypothetical protein